MYTYILTYVYIQKYICIRIPPAGRGAAPAHSPCKAPANGSLGMLNMFTYVYTYMYIYIYIYTCIYGVMVGGLRVEHFSTIRLG